MVIGRNKIQSDVSTFYFLHNYYNLHLNGIIILLNSIKSEGLEPKKDRTSKRIKVSLSLTLIVFVFTMSPTPLFPNLNTVSAAALTGVSATPTSNVVNERATYDLFLTTNTAATIKKIEITFPSSFDLSQIRLIERSNIGTGSLSVAGSTLTYTLNTAESVSAGKTIRLEIGRIIATADGSFTVSIKTLNTSGGTIDGPTTSGSFVIKSIVGEDVSPSFMIRKTLLDDAAGHAQGWDPNGVQFFRVITDSDITAPLDSTFVSVMIRGSANAVCDVTDTAIGSFSVNCLGGAAPAENAQLHYEISKLPSHVVTSSLSATASSTISSPFSLLGEH